LKEQQAKLILERHEWEDKEETHRQLQHEVDNLKRKHQLIIDENNLLSIKVYIIYYIVTCLVECCHYYAAARLSALHASRHFAPHKHSFLLLLLIFVRG
jgi:hypothetical protein